MKKFHRSKKHKVIAGVAGGAAEYFEIDPALVRLVFVLMLWSWTIIAAYIAAWVFVPIKED